MTLYLLGGPPSSSFSLLMLSAGSAVVAACVVSPPFASYWALREPSFGGLYSTSLNTTRKMIISENFSCCHNNLPRANQSVTTCKFLPHIDAYPIFSFCTPKID
ncbi:hypothetical protein ACH5RR_014491 [Cinchona calisaya]|uniref:Secreted protein n=1 Tax=Cinchona calisaya TaxID=153742 RepID=A0ABD3A347_9GENT